MYTQLQVTQTTFQVRAFGGLTQSKHCRIELFYRYKTSRITVSNIRKLYLYFVYFILF